MICRIYERRLRTLRDITDPRAAKPIDKIEFEGGRHHENIAEIKRQLVEKGLKVASGPGVTPQASEVDFVVYVEPSPANSPREVYIVRAAQKKKPVLVVGRAGGRKLQLPSSRR